MRHTLFKLTCDGRLKYGATCTRWVRVQRLDDARDEGWLITKRAPYDRAREFCSQECHDAFYARIAS